MHYILYNPMTSSNKSNRVSLSLLKKISKKEECYRISLLEIGGKEANFVQKCTKEDVLIICGGDGTLDHFVNQIYGINIECKILYHPCGTGNDFTRNFKGKFINIVEVVKKVPKVKINSQNQHIFLNGVGMGIDAVVCRDKAQYRFSEVNKSYFSISLAALKRYRTYSLDLEVDGELRHYDNVWFFAVNHGRYMGGGMRVAPKADRNAEYLDVCVVHSLSHKKIITLFPFIYLGLHIKFKKYVDYFKCKTIKAIPEGCNILQRDGEVVENVSQVEIQR